MIRSTPRQRSPRSTGLLIALAFALIGAGVVLFVALINKPASPLDAAKRSAVPDAEEPTDITSVGGTTDARIQVVDKKRPGRVASDFLFRKLNPIGGGTYDVSEPRAYLYLVDGRTIYVRSDTGRIRLPSQSDAPESGEFTGNGLVLVFPARQAGDTRPLDVERDTPGLVAHFKAASFDTVLLEVSTRDEVTIETDESVAVMQGALVRGNQVQERLEFARLGPGDFRYRIDRNQPAATPSPLAFTAAPPAPISTGAGTALATKSDDPASRPSSTLAPAESDSKSASAALLPTPQPAKEDLYRAYFTGGVTVTQSTRQLTSDTLTVWTRFLDNKLPEGVFGARSESSDRGMDIDSGPRDFASTLPLPIVAMIPALAIATAGPANSLFAPRSSDVILAWRTEVTTAPLSASPVPKELTEGNHLHVRFTSDKPGGESRVTITDSEIRAIGVCATLDYAATSRLLVLSNSESWDRVDMTAPALGRMVGPNISFNLGSGVGQIRGPGMLLSLQSDRPTVVPPADPDAPLPDDAFRQVTWTDQADFKLFSRNNRVEDLLEEARFTGNARARDHSSLLAGDFLAIEFDRIERSGSKPRSSPKRLQIQGHAVAIGGPSPKHTDWDRPLPALDPNLMADMLDIRFKPSASARQDVDPTSLTASGRVRISDRNSSMNAGRLVAELVRQGDDEIGVGDLVAEGGVRIDRKDGVWTTADKLVASGTERWADLTGGSVALGRGDGSVIRGPQAHLEEATGLLRIFGAGSFEHTQFSESASRADPLLAALADPDVLPSTMKIRATWSRAMMFENYSGRIECHGDTEVSARSAIDGRVARCERLLLNITPESNLDSGPLPALPAPGGSLLKDMNERQLITAEMIGSALERDGGALASVKTWRYGFSPAGERTFDQVLYLEAPRLLTDEQTGTLTVPSAGRGLAFDAGMQAATAGSAGAGSPTVGSSGDSSFTWHESLVFVRTTGDLKMLRDVELQHLPLGAAEKIIMRCNDLTGRFDTQQNGGGRLLFAKCIDGAYAESGSRTLTADEFNYDGLTDVITATSTSELPVAINDTNRAAPLLAKRLIWDRRIDRIEIQEPMPITAPMTK